MAQDWLSKTNMGLLNWGLVFKNVTTAGPSDFGLEPSQCTAFGLLYDDYAAKLALSTAPETRTRGSVIATQDAKRALIQEARRLVRIVQAYPELTNQQRADISIPIRDSEPTVLNPPGTAPAVTVSEVVGRLVRLRVRDAAEPDSRAIPANADGADLYSFVGESPVAFGDPGWTYEGRTTRTITNVVLPNSVPGGVKVWFAAHWVNRRGRGPTCMPVSTYLQAGPADMAEAA